MLQVFNKALNRDLRQYQSFPHFSPLLSTLLTFAIKACTTVNSSFFSSKYFYFYNIKVSAKAPSNFRQHHLILTCLALCKPVMPLASHISTSLFQHACIFHFFQPPTQLEAFSPLIAMAVLFPACFYLICIICYLILLFFS